MKNKPKKACVFRKNKAGFTLVEILVAITLILFGLLGAAQLQVMTIFTNSTSSQRTTAITLAQDRLEELRTRPFAQIGTPPFSDTSGLYTRTWTIQNNTPAAGMAQVTVTVTWKGKQVQAQSIIANGLS
ncbi:MAG: prepilin-type N-terminal cleavage/methylation domain-containing protein [Thermodesulfobacteriota bacterium]